jgi:hypothetical protein
MSRVLRLIVVFAAALWLPLQAVAAVFLPLCQHHVSTEGVAQGAHPCDSHDAAPAEPLQDDCDQCGFCQLAGASTLPATSVASFALPLDGKNAVPPAPTFNSYIPEPPHHPPKA